MRTTAEPSSRKKLTQEQVDKALDDHALWLENKTSFLGLVRAGRRADFTNCDLCGLDFSQRDLRHVMLKGALVTGAVFDGATFDSKVFFRSPHPSELRRAFSTSAIPRSVRRTEEPSADPGVNLVNVASAISPSPSAPATDEIALDWHSFVDSRTPAQPQRWTPSLDGHPFTWYPSAFPRPSAPPIEHALEL